MECFSAKLLPVVLSMLVCVPFAHAASEHGTEAEAQDMVKKAVALVKSAGAEKAYKVFTDHIPMVHSRKRTYMSLCTTLTEIAWRRGPTQKWSVKI